MTRAASDAALEARRLALAQMAKEQGDHPQGGSGARRGAAHSAGEEGGARSSFHPPRLHASGPDAETGACVRTTLDGGLQRIAEKELIKRISRGDRAGAVRRREVQRRAR
jgi:hypothetical protein